MSKASETLSGVYKFELVWYMYIRIYIWVWRYVCHNSSTCHAYVMWAELGHRHFLCVPAVSNIVTTGNGTGTKMWNRALQFLCLVSSLLSTALLLQRYYCSKSKPILYLDTVYYYKFYSMHSVEIDPYSCEQTYLN